MTKVIGVRFRRAGKIYFFAPGKYTDISEGDHVIVETARGVEYGNVVLGIRDVEYEKVIQPLKAVIRVAAGAPRPWRPPVRTSPAGSARRCCRRRNHRWSAR